MSTFCSVVTLGSALPSNSAPTPRSHLPLLLALGKKSKGLFWNLGALSLGMLVFAWIAETSPLGGGVWWGFYIVSCIFWVLIVKQLYGQVTSAASHLPEAFQGQLGVMKKFMVWKR